MKFSYTKPCAITRALLFTCLFFSMISQAQVGIGNTNPNPSSALDITSTTQGLLAPRMTTAQRNTIISPANSLLVYDTDEKSFYYYNLPSTTWVKINASTNQRNYYKLVKSAADLAPELTAGGGSKYLLQTNTFYEINGTISLAFPIDLNDAYVSGIDANEDKLIRSSNGPIFEGTKGGSIRNITLVGGALKSAFNITGGSSLLIQNTIVANFANVGVISNLTLYFGNIIQFVGNNNGIIYTNINNLLLNNQAWNNTNGGTFEKFTGNFDLIEKVSGYTIVPNGAIGLDVNFSTTPLVVGTGVMLGTVFSGVGTYVRPYPAGSTYSGYNFSTAWTVNCPGIPRESDDVATGDINFTGNGTPTTFPATNGIKTKILGATSSNNLFRFERDLNNKIIYKGNKSRYFQVVSSLSFEQTQLATFIFYIAVNGNLIAESRVNTKPATSNGLFVSNDAGIQSAPIVGNILLKKDDYVEIYAVRDTGTGNISTVSLNLSIR